MLHLIPLMLISILAVMDNNLAGALIVFSKATLTVVDYWIIIQKKKLHDQERGFRNHEQKNSEPDVRKNDRQEDGPGG